MDRQQRLLKVYRLRDHDDVTVHFPWDFPLQRRLSPEVLG